MLFPHGGRIRPTSGQPTSRSVVDRCPRYTFTEHSSTGTEGSPMKSIRVVAGALLFAAVAAAQPYLISTLAGGVLPPIPARGVDLPIGNLQGVAADDAGDVYFSSLNSVFKVDPNG